MDMDANIFFIKLLCLRSSVWSKIRNTTGSQARQLQRQLPSHAVPLPLGRQR